MTKILNTLKLGSSDIVLHDVILDGKELRYQDNRKNRDLSAYDISRHTNKMVSDLVSSLIYLYENNADTPLQNAHSSLFRQVVQQLIELGIIQYTNSKYKKRLLASTLHLILTLRR
jgi:hypothetical protein